MKYSRSLSGTENSWCGHQQSYNFFPVFANFRTLLATQENQNWLIRSGKISCSWGKTFCLIISKGKIFRADRKKSLYCYLLVSRCQQLCLQHYFGDHEDLYIFSSLFCFSFVINNTKPTSLDCVNSNIYSCILSLLKLHRTF